MVLLLLHLIGDYLLQTDWMAKNKRAHLWPATMHAVTYTLPFYFYYKYLGGIELNITQVLVIGGTHLLIDHFALARYVIFVKNWVTDTSLRWRDCDKTGYRNDMPAWMSVWLLIITDNTLHLLLNYIAITYL